MTIPGGTAGTPTPARTLEAGALLIGLGAALLLVSLFLEWYQPGADAWDVFEVWDLVLAVLAIGALVAVASRLGFGPPRPASWLVGPACAALVIVVYALLDPPPAAAGLLDGDPSTGLWLALAAAILMTIGAVLSVARVSVAITAAGPITYDPGHDPVDVTEPRRSGRFTRRPDAPLSDETTAPVGRGAAGGPPTEPTRRL
jgi:peptidoglycan/LPS O-acetylase OafA/YrhL